MSIDARALTRLVGSLGASVRRAPSAQYALARGVAEGVKQLAEHRVRRTKLAPDGSRWKRWSPRYAATRTAKHSLLVDTKRLSRSFRAQASPAGRVAKIWNTAPYAGYVQAKRPFFGIGPAEETLIEGLTLAYMRKLIS
jgi:hypothetical protein